MGCIVKSNDLKVKSLCFQNTNKNIITSNINMPQKKHPRISEEITVNSKTKNISSSSLKPYKLIIKKAQDFSFVPKSNEDYSKKLRSKVWISVFDFLTFKELHEVGKVNYLFNNIAKNENILKKFFKHKIKTYPSDKTNQISKIMKRAILVNITIHSKKDINFSRGNLKKDVTS